MLSSHATKYTASLSCQLFISERCDSSSVSRISSCCCLQSSILKNRSPGLASAGGPAAVWGAAPPCGDGPPPILALCSRFPLSPCYACRSLRRYLTAHLDLNHGHLLSFHGKCPAVCHDRQGPARRGTTRPTRTQAARRGLKPMHGSVPRTPVHSQAGDRVPAAP